MADAVVDASVVVAAYVGDEPLRDRAVRALTAASELAVPAHFDIEILSALRRMSRSNPTIDRIALSVLAHLAALPVRRIFVPRLLPRMWSLRANVTTYDAAYVALADLLRVPLITCDARLATASGPTCAIELIA